jgi:hypothetical protein
MTTFMRASDAFTWAMETDPRLRSTVVSVILLERAPDWDEVRARFDEISRRLPMFRQRVVESTPPAPPRWEYYPDFELDYHLRRAVVPEPGSLAAVLEMARVADMQDFDRLMNDSVREAERLQEEAQRQAREEAEQLRLERLRRQEEELKREQEKKQKERDELMEKLKR